MSARAGALGPHRRAGRAATAPRCRRRPTRWRSTRFLGERRAADPQRFADLSLAVVKLLGSGDYAPSAGGAAQCTAHGHFGLAVNDYAHSTAPNRRFPDLVTQRLLKAALAGAAPPYGWRSARRRSRSTARAQEDNANKVERQVLKAAGAVLLQGRIGQTFDGHRDRRPRQGHLRAPHEPDGRGPRRARPSRASTSATACGVRLAAVDAERGFIDFERV